MIQEWLYPINRFKVFSAAYQSECIWWRNNYIFRIKKDLTFTSYTYYIFKRVTGMQPLGNCICVLIKNAHRFEIKFNGILFSNFKAILTRDLRSIPNWMVLGLYTKTFRQIFIKIRYLFLFMQSGDTFHTKNYLKESYQGIKQESSLMGGDSEEINSFRCLNFGQKPPFRRT